MPRSLRLIASTLGFAAGLVGSIHGYYETQQGNMAPSSVFINAIGGTACQPNCLPAMTIIPSFLAAGIATIILGFAIIGWISVKLKDREGGIGLMILSVALLFAGGGFLAPILGIIGGIIGLRIKKSEEKSRK